MPVAALFWILLSAGAQGQDIVELQPWQEALIGTSISEAPQEGLFSNEVNVSLVVTRISELNEVTGKSSAYVDVQMTWEDKRIFDAIGEQAKLDCSVHAAAIQEQQPSFDEFNHNCIESKPGNRKNFASVPRSGSNFTKEQCRDKKEQLVRISRQVPLLYYMQNQSSLHRAKCKDSLTWLSLSNASIPFQKMRRTGPSKFQTLAKRVVARLLGAHAHLYAWAPVWTPVSDQLMPFSHANPVSHTSAKVTFDVNLSSLRLIFLAELEDNMPTEFDFQWKYDAYPFDEQILPLCIDFSNEVRARLHRRMYDRTFTMQPAGELVQSRSKWNFETSDLSIHISGAALAQLGGLGYQVLDVYGTGDSSSAEVCVNIRISRRSDVLALRFFGPLLLLVTTPLAGFVLPITDAMPRIATCFISFLSLQVFRNAAYNMVPKSCVSLNFIDVFMFSVTELLFLVVLENIAAQRLFRSYSRFAGERLDTLSLMLFPSTALVMTIALFIMGFSRTPPLSMFLTSQVILFVVLLIAILCIFCFIRNLPHNIMLALISDIKSEKLIWSQHRQLDIRELSKIFQYMDKDRSGHLEPQEIVINFKASGLHLGGERAEQAMIARIIETCGRQVDFDSFRSHFQDIFGGEFAHFRRSLTRSFTQHDKAPAPAVDMSMSL